MKYRVKRFSSAFDFPNKRFEFHTTQFSPIWTNRLRTSAASATVECRRTEAVAFVENLVTDIAQRHLLAVLRNDDRGGETYAAIDLDQMTWCDDTDKREDLIVSLVRRMFAVNYITMKRLDETMAVQVELFIRDKLCRQKQDSTTSPFVAANNISPPANSENDKKAPPTYIKTIQSPKNIELVALHIFIDPAVSSSIVRHANDKLCVGFMYVIFAVQEARLTDGKTFLVIERRRLMVEDGQAAVCSKGLQTTLETIVHATFNFQRSLDIDQLYVIVKTFYVDLPLHARPFHEYLLLCKKDDNLWCFPIDPSHCQLSIFKPAVFTTLEFCIYPLDGTRFIICRARGTTHSQR